MSSTYFGSVSIQAVCYCLFAVQPSRSPLPASFHPAHTLLPCLHFSLHICMYVYVYVYVYVSVHVHLYVYVYAIWVCICICICILSILASYLYIGLSCYVIINVLSTSLSLSLSFSLFPVHPIYLFVYLVHVLTFPRCRSPSASAPRVMSIP